MSNQINEVNDITPYLEAFSFFLKESILKKYNDIYKQELNKIELSNFIKNIKNDVILKNDILKKQPQKAFNYLLNELHKTFKKEEENEEIEKENKNKSAEINKENAFLSFKRFMDKDKSFISENFFGIKLISKKCQTCHMTQYLFKYMRAIEIIIIDIEEKENELDLEKCFKKIPDIKINKNDFCPMCAINKDLEIGFEVVKCPKIMIFILPEEKGLKFKVKTSIGNEKYKMIAAQIKNHKSIFDIFKFFCSPNKKSRLIQGGQINDDIFSEEIPLVLFYEKKEDRGMLNQNIYNKINELKDSFFLNREKEVKEKYDDNNSEENKLGKKYEDDIMIENSQKDEKSINNEINKITLFFKIEKGGKEMFIDTSNSNTFSNMLKELKSRYELIEDIDENKLFFNDINIDVNKTPKHYRIPNNSYILIKN